MDIKAYRENYPEKGMALIVLIVIMFLLGVIAYAFVSIVTTHHYSTQSTLSSVKSFYIGEGAVEIGLKWVTQTQAHSWSSPTDSEGYYWLYLDHPLGDGHFDLGIKWVTDDDIKIMARATSNQ